MLKDILENAVPVTFQDVVVTFCTVTGWRNGQLVQISDARKIYHQTDRRRELERDPDHDRRRHLRGARSASSRADCRERGFVRQEQVDFDDVPRQPLRPVLRVAERYALQRGASATRTADAMDADDSTTTLHAQLERPRSRCAPSAIGSRWLDGARRARSSARSPIDGEPLAELPARRRRAGRRGDRRGRGRVSRRGAIVPAPRARRIRPPHSASASRAQGRPGDARQLGSRQDHCRKRSAKCRR